jgi:diguanylate cyclase (GGDEF)-like protein
MSLDLDRFKVINDTLGHASGDEILRQAAARLAGIHRESDTVARVGGDEFLLLLRGCSSVSDAETAAHKILQAFDLPFSADGQEIRLTTSIGISRYPVDGGDMEAVIRNADTAMYYAKESGRHTYRMYSQAANGQAEDRMTIESELRRAIPGQLEVWYQPQLDLRDSTIMTVEALVRWNHPQRGIILPGEFISVAEDSGLIVPLGEYVLREACATVRGWTEAGLPPVRVAVNISMRQFSQPDLVGMVARILARTGLEPSYLELEITESTAARDMKRTVELLRQLEAMGVRISIDDFGTGYSAFGSLRQLPLHALKIDRSLICDIEHDPGDAAIAANIISLAHNLGLEVIAEGVETEQQLNFLKQEGCDAYQGYLCARPMTAGQMAGILAQGRGECRCQGSPEDPARTASATPDRSA